VSRALLTNVTDVVKFSALGNRLKTSRRIGVALLQLGGPDSLDAIEPFLYNLFCDPEIIDFPFARIGRKPLARLISSTRAKKVRHHYEVIGNGSPLRRITEMQAALLESELRERGVDAATAVAMRYWHPFTTEAIARLEAAGCDEFILLPLYPQYSSTTTGSSVNEWKRSSQRPAHIIQDFYRNDRYLAAVVERIDETLARFAAPPHLVFSAHSVPVGVIESGDPYQRQIEETVALVLERGAFSWNGGELPHRLCYQSKVGASRWLQPSLRATIRELALAGEKNICVVPISFVSDHVETLGEIDHETRALACECGIAQFEMVPGLNDSPRFISALADLVCSSLGLQSQPESHDAMLIGAD
jgi:ferrochelatase